MDDITAKAELSRLDEYLSRINKLNEFDLAWEWDGRGYPPYVRVYEEADNHELIGGVIENVILKVQEALPHWSLEDPGLPEQRNIIWGV